MITVGKEEVESLGHPSGVHELERRQLLDGVEPGTKRLLDRFQRHVLIEDQGISAQLGGNRMRQAVLLGIVTEADYLYSATERIVNLTCLIPARCGHEQITSFKQATFPKLRPQTPPIDGIAFMFGDVLEIAND